MRVKPGSLGSASALEKGQFFVQILDMCNAERVEDVKVFVRTSPAQTGHFGSSVFGPVTFALPTTIKEQYVLCVENPEVTPDQFVEYKKLCEDNLKVQVHPLSRV